MIRETPESSTEDLRRRTSRFCAVEEILASLPPPSPIPTLSHPLSDAIQSVSRSCVISPLPRREQIPTTANPSLSLRSPRSPCSLAGDYTVDESGMCMQKRRRRGKSSSLASDEDNSLS